LWRIFATWRQKKQRELANSTKEFFERFFFKIRHISRKKKVRSRQI
jgi:hypothetical protein